MCRLWISGKNPGECVAEARVGDAEFSCLMALLVGARTRRPTTRMHRTSSAYGTSADCEVRASSGMGAEQYRTVHDLDRSLHLGTRTQFEALIF